MSSIYYVTSNLSILFNGHDQGNPAKNYPSGMLETPRVEEREEDLGIAFIDLSYHAFPWQRHSEIINFVTALEHIEIIFNFTGEINSMKKMSNKKSSVGKFVPLHSAKSC